jgi:hypothetical protein
MVITHLQQITLFAYLLLVGIIKMVPLDPSPPTPTGSEQVLYPLPSYITHSFLRHVHKMAKKKNNYSLYHVCMSICPSVCMEKLGSHQMDFQGI